MKNLSRARVPNDAYQVSRPSAIWFFPVSILYKSIAGRYRPVRVADGPITARYRVIKNASWVQETTFKVFLQYIGMADILVMWPRHHEQTSVPPPQGGSACNLVQLAWPFQGRCHLNILTPTLLQRHRRRTTVYSISRPPTPPPPPPHTPHHTHTHTRSIRLCLANKKKYLFDVIFKMVSLRIKKMICLTSQVCLHSNSKVSVYHCVAAVRNSPYMSYSFHHFLISLLK